MSRGIVAKSIILARNESGLTQEQLAEKVGVPRTTIANWETGKFSPSNKNVELLSKLFDKPTFYFLAIDDEEGKLSTSLDKFFKSWAQGKGYSIEDEGAEQLIRDLVFKDKEIELLIKEVELLRRENVLLEKENEQLQKKLDDILNEPVI